jgi:hypothetical protein
MAWQMLGHFMELCNCKMFCPCWIGPAEPDQGWCGGALIFEVQQGTANGVSLDGVKMMLLLEWPGDFWGGNGTARLFLDAAASADQRKELEPILTGKNGGPLEPVLNAVITTWLPTEIAPIAINRGDTTTVTVGNVAQVHSARIRNDAGQPTTIQGAAAMGAFQLTSLDLARSDGSRFTDPAMRQWDAGGSGTLSTFSWTS